MGHPLPLHSLESLLRLLPHNAVTLQKLYFIANTSVAQPGKAELVVGEGKEEVLELSKTQQLRAGQPVLLASSEDILVSTGGACSSHLDNHSKQPGKRSIVRLFWRMDPLPNASSLPSPEGSGC